MLIVRKILLFVLVVLVLSSAANAFGAGTSSNRRNGQPTLADASHARNRSVTRRHHRHRSSIGSKRVPKAKSLEKESW
jgi:hypothetical protein